jgi:membrane protein DedA with SNARE-associated domain
MFHGAARLLIGILNASAVANWLASNAPLLIFVNLALGILGLPVIPEALLVFTGAHILGGDRSLTAALAAGILGSVVGVTVSYQFGRHGVGVAQRWRFLTRLVGERRIASAAGFCRRVGATGIALGYFAPGARHLTAMGAGVADMKLGTFLAAAFTGAAMWVGMLVWIGFAVGSRASTGSFPWYVPLTAWTALVVVALRAARRPSAEATL